MPTYEALRDRLARIPIFKTRQLKLRTMTSGKARLTAVYDPAYEGIFNSFHGGLLMTLADTATCVAALTLTGPDAIITTTDMNSRFLVACRSDARAEARVVKFGKALCPVSVDLRDAQTTRVAVAQVTCMRLQKR